MAEPLFLVGGPALTEFRLARLVQNLQAVLPEPLVVAHARGHDCQVAIG